MSFSSSCCSYFMVAFDRRNCSGSLFNSVFKYLSNIFIAYSDVYFVNISMLAPFFLKYGNPLLHDRIQTDDFVTETIFHYLSFVSFSCIFPIPMWFRLRFLKNIILPSQPSFCCNCICFRLIKLCVILYLFFSIH